MLLRLYDLALCLGIALASPWLLLRILVRARYRRGLLQRLALRVPGPARGHPRFWIHAASAGEMTAAAPLHHELTARFPGCHVRLSSTTTSGVAVAERLMPGSEAFIQPLDVGLLVRRVAGRVAPDALVLFELELWPNLIDAAARAGARVVVANGRVSARSARGLRRAWRRRFVGMDRVDLFAVQTDEYRDRLLSLGVARERISVTGNLKADAARPDAALRARLRAELRAAEEDRVVVAGSTHPGEEALVAKALTSLSRRIVLVVAPRHGERLAAAEQDLVAAGRKPLRWSALRRGAAAADTVVVDTMGDLASLYAAADVALVGGSLLAGVGGHNVFEPVLAGAPVVIGPHHANVRSDVTFLREAGALVVLEHGEPDAMAARFAEVLVGLFAGEGETVRAAAATAMESARGAADRTAGLIADLLAEPCA